MEPTIREEEIFQELERLKQLRAKAKSPDLADRLIKEARTGEHPLPYDQIADLLKKHGIQMGTSTVRDRWHRIEREEQL